MHTRIWLAVALLVICFLCGVWDIWVTSKGNVQDTVSRTLQDWSLAYPVLPLVLGVLLGHIFWPTSTTTIERSEPQQQLERK